MPRRYLPRPAPARPGPALERGDQPERGGLVDAELSGDARSRRPRRYERGSPGSSRPGRRTGRCSPHRPPRRCLRSRRSGRSRRDRELVVARRLRRPPPRPRWSLRATRPATPRPECPATGPNAAGCCSWRNGSASTATTHPPGPLNRQLWLLLKGLWLLVGTLWTNAPRWLRLPTVFSHVRASPAFPTIPSHLPWQPSSGSAGSGYAPRSPTARFDAYFGVCTSRCTSPDTIDLRAQAAALVVSTASVLCDRTAAWLHGIDVMWHAEHDIIPPLDTFVLRDHSRTRRSQTNAGERDLAPRDMTTVFGVAVTTPLRTALDLGCNLPRRDALAALDAFMRVFELSREDLLREVPRYFRRRGVRQLRGLVPLADPRAESPGESWTRLAIIDENLPPPQLQWEIRRDNRVLFRLDLAYPGLKICIEYDGEEHHDSPAAQLADDERRTWLRERGGSSSSSQGRTSATTESRGGWGSFGARSSRGGSPFASGRVGVRRREQPERPAHQPQVPGQPTTSAGSANHKCPVEDVSRRVRYGGG